MVLIDIINVLDKNFTIHIGIDGHIVGVFSNTDDIPYKYLKMRVKRIRSDVFSYYSGDVAPKAIMGIDLETLDNED